MTMHDPLVSAAGRGAAPAIDRRRCLAGGLAAAGAIFSAAASQAAAQNAPATPAAGGAASASASATAQASAQAASQRPADEPFGYCFNTSTIRGQKLGIVRVAEIAAQAGYDGLEPWIGEIETYQKEGGSLPDLAKRLRDLNLTVESSIGFAEWIVDDEERRKKGYETAKRDMDLVRQIGGKRIAAPPAGATKQNNLNLFAAAERFRKLIEIGSEIGVRPQLEVWGFSETLSRLGETVFVAVEAGREDALILPDIYHIRRGGSDFAGLALLAGSAVEVFHVNDYPAAADRKTLTDAMRVYPGDGVAPCGPIFKLLRDGGFRGMLSLELFNPDYWKQDPLEVAKTGLAKTKAAVKAALKA